MRLPVGPAGLRAALLLIALFGAAALARLDSCMDPREDPASPATLDCDGSDEDVVTASDVEGHFSDVLLTPPLFAAERVACAAPRAAILVPPQRSPLSRPPPARA